MISCGVVVARGRGPQHGALQSQHADLRVERGGVRTGDAGHAELAVEHAPDRRQVDAELAQRAHQLARAAALAS